MAPLGVQRATALFILYAFASPDGSAAGAAVVSEALAGGSDAVDGLSPTETETTASPADSVFGDFEPVAVFFFPPVFLSVGADTLSAGAVRIRIASADSPGVPDGADGTDAGGSVAATAGPLAEAGAAAARRAALIASRLASRAAFCPSLWLAASCCSALSFARYALPVTEKTALFAYLLI